jgi:hypothetical protein
VLGIYCCSACQPRFVEGHFTASFDDHMLENTSNLKLGTFNHDLHQFHHFDMVPLALESYTSRIFLEISAPVDTLLPLSANKHPVEAFKSPYTF